MLRFGFDRPAKRAPRRRARKAGRQTSTKSGGILGQWHSNGAQLSQNSMRRRPLRRRAYRSGKRRRHLRWPCRRSSAGARRSRRGTRRSRSGSGPSWPLQHTARGHDVGGTGHRRLARHGVSLAPRARWIGGVLDGRWHRVGIAAHRGGRGSHCGRVSGWDGVLGGGSRGNGAANDRWQTVASRDVSRRGGPCCRPGNRCP